MTPSFLLPTYKALVSIPRHPFQSPDAHLPPCYAYSFLKCEDFYVIVSFPVRLLLIHSTKLMNTSLAHLLPLSAARYLHIPIFISTKLYLRTLSPAEQIQFIKPPRIVHSTALTLQTGMFPRRILTEWRSCFHLLMPMFFSSQHKDYGTYYYATFHHSPICTSLLY
jgi:hypothetical protein